MKSLGKQKKVILMKGKTILISVACYHSLLKLFYLWSETMNMMNMMAFDSAILVKKKV